MKPTGKTIIITTVGGRAVPAAARPIASAPAVKTVLSKPSSPAMAAKPSPLHGVARPASGAGRITPTAALLQTGLTLPVGTTLSGQPRKRERLTHLTPEEKLNRRKLKNRIAAQTARDRKKLKMASLEVATTDMQAENEALLEENEALRAQNAALADENARLRAELEMRSSEPTASETLGSAAFISAPLQREQVSAPTLLSLLTTLLSLSSPGCSRTSSQPETPATKPTPWAPAASARPQLEEMRAALIKGHRLSESQLQLLAQLTQSLWSKGRLKAV